MSRSGYASSRPSREGCTLYSVDPVGRACTRDRTVGAADTASAVGSGGVEALSTPSMIGLMEMAARDAVQDLLPPGWTTVGTMLDVRHLSATPAGERVSATAVVTEADGRRLVFRVTASDRLGLIGEGRHERSAVDLGRFTKGVSRRFAAGSAREVCDDE